MGYLVHQPLTPSKPIMFPGRTPNTMTLMAVIMCQMDSVQYWKKWYYLMTATHWKPDTFQGTQVSEQEEFQASFYWLRESATECASISCALVVYRGKLHAPCWKDIEPCKYSPSGWHLISDTLHSCFYTELSNLRRYICGCCSTPSKEITWGKNLLSHRL